ncbi:MAG: GGDEF domain-containing protein [Lachnospiraceae bacterium]|nr:GGDEF domain-containing protein [Lachnospiraceae bacterium]
MKRFRLFKLIQSLLLLVLAALSLYLPFRAGAVPSGFSLASGSFILCLIIWILCICSFIFILIDMFLLQKFDSEHLSLSNLTYKDTLTGLPNRTSCDSILFQCIDNDTFKDIGLVLLRLDNLEDVNKAEGCPRGDVLLVNFSKLLSRVGMPYGNVVRNNSHGFAIIIRDGHMPVLNQFAESFQKHVSSYNQSGQTPKIMYSISMVDNSIDNHTTPRDLVGYASHHLEKVI